MDSYILFNILEYADQYNVNNLFEIKPDNTNINDIIDIILQNKIIHDQILQDEWKEKYTFDVVHELISIYFYINSNSINNNIKSNLIKSKKIVKNKYLLNLEIKHLFKNQYSKILQSRLSLNDLIKYRYNILLPSCLILDFYIMRNFNNFKFLE